MEPGSGDSLEGVPSRRDFHRESLHSAFLLPFHQNVGKCIVELFELVPGGNFVETQIHGVNWSILWTTSVTDANKGRYEECFIRD